MFRTSKLLEFKEFNKTIIPFALVGYESGYSQLGATRYALRAHAHSGFSNSSMVTRSRCGDGVSVVMTVPHRVELI